MYNCIAVGYLEDRVELQHDIFAPSTFGEEPKAGEYKLFNKGDILDKKKINALSNVKVLNQDIQKVVLTRNYRSQVIQTPLYKSLLGLTNEFFDTILSSKMDTEKVDRLSEAIYAKIASGGSNELMGIVGGPGSLKDYLKSHTLHVGILNGLLAWWMNLEQHTIREAITTGLLHDIGKLEIENEILDKPGRLTIEEYERIREHSELGFNIIKHMDGISDNIKRGVIEHHEKVDGTGYPRGLKYNQISIHGKLTAISDVFDAITSKRAYHEPENPFSIIDQYSRNCFVGFDVNMVNTFLVGVTEALVGQKVILSDLSCRTVIFINEFDYSFPLVQMNGDVTNTNESLSVLHLV